MTAVNPATSQQAVVEAALVLLERMGLSPEDLTAVPRARREVPTFAEYVPVVSAAVSAGTAGRTARTGTGSSSIGVAAAWTKFLRRRFGSL